MLTQGKQALEEIMTGVLEALGVQADVECFDRDINRASMNVKGVLNDKPFEGKMHIIGNRLVLDIPAIDKKEVDYLLPIAMALIPEAIKLAKNLGGKKKKSKFGKLFSKGAKLAGIAGGIAAGLKKKTAKGAAEQAEIGSEINEEPASEEEEAATPEEGEATEDFDKVIEKAGKFVKKNGLQAAVDVLDNFIADEVDFDEVVSQLLDD